MAEDPKTGESGLVPEEFVRLLRDIEGGWNSLNGEAASTDSGLLSPLTSAPDAAVTPTQSEHTRLSSATQSGPSAHSSNGSGASGEKHPPMVSTFSTSSRDLDPYPPHLLGAQGKAGPPQVVHHDGEKGGGGEHTIPILSSPPVEAKKAEKLARRGSRRS